MMTRLFFLVAVYACCCSFITAYDTFQLFYDGIVSPEVVQSFQDESNVELLPSQIPYKSLVSDLSTSIMTDVIQTFLRTKDPKKSSSDFTDEERTLEMDRRCYESKTGEGRCTVDYDKGDRNVMIHLDSHVYSNQNHAMLRLQVSITYSDGFLAKDVLVKCVPKINNHIKYFHGVVWSIQERLTPTSEPLLPVTVPASQYIADLKASSVETLILSQPTLQNRMRIASITSSNRHTLEVWQYHDATLVEPVRSLFVSGQLLTTTHPSGTAHAEALVHPALISSEYPEYVVIVSLDPISVLKEVLKHKGVKKVVILGMDSAIVEMTQMYMPRLDDCSFLGTGLKSCLEQAIVEIVDLDVKAWMKLGAERIATLKGPDIDIFDKYIGVVYIDVPIGNDDWLDVEFHRDVHGNLDDSSVVVVAAGSQPKLFDVEDDHLSPRDQLLRQAYRDTPHGLGIDMGSVYDEPLAAPLSTAFLIFFVRVGSATSRSFMRTNSPAIEVDLIEKLHANIAVLPTLLYDGMTHRQYTTMSRAWEHWYCKSLPGRNLPICHTFLKQWFNADNHFYATEVRQHPIKGRALFATEDCPAGHFVLPHDAGLNIRVDSQQWIALNKFVDDFPEAEMYTQLRDFFISYGFESEPLGTTGWSASIACNNTFSNHGCTPKEVNVNWMESAYYGEENFYSPFSPPLVRKSELLGVLVEAAQDIKAGDEIMCDYGAFREPGGDDSQYALFLANMCDHGIGLVPSKKVGAPNDTYGERDPHKGTELQSSSGNNATSDEL